jgi:hypothetical protein
MLNPAPSTDSIQSSKIPLVDIQSLQKWIKNNTIIQGVSSRWIIPTRVGLADTILLVVNITEEKKLGFIN